MLSPILLISAGIAGFATAGCLGALCFGKARQRWHTMVLFAIMSIALATYSVCNLLRNASPSPAAVIELTRGTDLCGSLFVLLLPFLYRDLSGQRAGRVEYVILGVYLFAMLVAVFRPTGLTWDSLTVMVPTDFGRLGRIYLPRGEYSRLLVPIHLFSLLVFCHCMRIAWAARRSDAASVSLLMVLPVLLIIVLVHTVGRTQGWWHGPSVNEYAGLALYLGMGASIFAREHELLNEQMCAEAALQQSERRLSLAISATADAIWEWNLNIDAAYCSPRWYEMLGYEDRAFQVNFEAWQRLCHPDDFKIATHRIQKMLTTPRSAGFEAECRMQTADGSWVWILIRGNVVEWDTEGKPVLVSGANTDISVRKMLEEQLRQAQKMQAIGQLAGGVAHDFNNLLHVILGHSEMLLSDMAEPDDPMRDSIAAIYAAAERASLLTRQLLMFSRKAILETEVLDLNAILEHTGHILRRLIGEDILLSMALPPSLSRIKADRGQIEQVCMNLSINARDAMPQGGKLMIETHNASFDEDYCRTHPDCKPGSFVRLSVSDTGCGIPPQVRAQIFEPFFTTKGPGKGTGLGLATVYGIVQQSGGFITLHSEVGVGTTFHIFLPAVNDAATSPPPDAENKSELTGNETVLLVEDEQEVRKIARQSLERHGYQVLEAINGQDAIRLAEMYSGQIDLLVTDVVMPGMSGGQLAETLCARRPSLRVLFMSGYNDDAVVRHGILDGHDAFLQKPFTPMVLGQRVRDLLDTRESSHD
jgi:PAS domain S-box-containing protein